MRNTARIVHLFTVSTALIAMLGTPAVASAEVDVVATLGDLGLVAREVGGEHVDVTTLARPSEDPHYVSAKPNYVRSLSKADLLVYNGMSLEVGWLPELIESARNGSIQEGSDGHFDASTAVEKMGVPDTEVTRKMGDVHPEGNPHYTFDPRQMARVSLALGDRLAALDGAHASTYEERARAFAKECLKLAKRWREKFEALSADRREIVVYHENWEYVTDWLGLEQVATVEPKPGVEPNPKHVARVVGTMQESDIPVVLKMEYYPGSTVSKIADKTGATVVTSQGQARKGQSYEERIESMVEPLYRELKGES